MDRKCIDGYTLSSNKKELYEYFNPQIVMDPIRNN